MTDDSPERELVTDYLVENYSRVTQTNQEGHSNLARDVSILTELRTSHKTPRREVRWKLDKCANNRSLEFIVRCFEDYLDRVSPSSADSPLRRITASSHEYVSHHCPGYLREEITLTADVSRSVVVAHQYPSQSEICTICGQLVRHPSNPVSHHTTTRRRQPSSISVDVDPPPGNFSPEPDVLEPMNEEVVGKLISPQSSNFSLHSVSDSQEFAEAVRFLKAVKSQFSDEPDVYEHFLTTLTQYAKKQ